MAGRGGWLLLCVAALALATTPLFFETYRTAAFNTIPHDDYAPYLLAMAGRGGAIPVPPFAYRVLSVAVAIPFFRVLPAYTFTNLANVPPPYLKAEEALAFASYICVVLTSLVVYALARRRHDVTRAAALIAALTSLSFNGLISMTGVDAIAILVIGAMLLALDRPAVFGALAIASIGINEKIPILFAAVLSARLAQSLARRRAFKLAPQLVLSGVAIAGYLALRMLWHVPGNDAQTNPALFVGHLRSTLAYSLSLKGAFLNLVPALVMGALALVAWHARRGTTFQTADGSGLFVLLLLAGLADVVYNVGRVAMYAYPLYLPAASAIVDDWRRG